MVKTKMQTINGNNAAAHVAYHLSEAAAIYPITPSSDMAEYCDEWTAKGKRNVFGGIPRVIEMQSEAGAAGTLHGLLAGGVLGTTFTASQGLLLMIPNMYKICGELLPCVMHVSARAVASHALSIFGDHSDVMGVRSTGWGMLCANSVQEAQDLALVAHLSAVEGSYPFVHFFDGFRTSHEFNKISVIAPEDMKKLVNFKKIEQFRKRALDPTRPHQQGTAQNPDTFFQNREAVNPTIAALPNIVQTAMDKVTKLTGRGYKLFDYAGDPAAKHIIIAMGSACETIEETLAQGTGLVKVRLYRPFNTEALLDVIPESAEVITVLDRTKENGSVGEPLYLDVMGAFSRSCESLGNKFKNLKKIISGRYGLSSKEFTPAMVRAVYENMKSETPKDKFTVGINDDVSHTSLDISWGSSFTTFQCCESPPHTPPTSLDVETRGFVFYGIGSDGTVGANKNSVAIVGDNTDMFAQAYFVYDSKKSGGTTISHLRFSDKPIKSAYVVTHPEFVACHNQTFLNHLDMFSGIREGGTFLLNTTYPHEEIAGILPPSVKKVLAERKINFYIVNAYKIAADLGLKGRINTIMQAAFFKLTEVIPFATAVRLMKAAIDKSYGKKGQAVLDMNYAAVDSAETAIVKIEIPDTWLTAVPAAISKTKNTGGRAYFNNFCRPILDYKGNDLPVSAFSADGRVPTATSKFEKRNIATMLPQWVPENCIQCNQCALVCPHGCIRPCLLSGAFPPAPPQFKTLKALGFPEHEYRIQLSPADCTGCGSCANVCPSKNKALVMRDFDKVDEVANYEYSLKIPYPNLDPTNIKNSQFLKPYFEFSGACAGCGETPYIKLASQLFGKRMIIANATGCTSIYGGSSPTCPYCTDENGHGPAWANSLFEDNAEFGLGIRLAYDIRGGYGGERPVMNPSVWIIGGDGWAYDIGYGGLDHVLASNEDVNILVLDTEVYSNTGGQSSKSTPAGAIAKFASGGKPTNKKDLGAMAMNYDNVYVAQVALGANYAQCLTAFREAEAHKGPSLIIAYSTCINHGMDMSNGMKTMKNAVECGYWTLYRRDPKVGLVIDSKAPTASYREFLSNENRYKALEKANPAAADKLFAEAEAKARARREKYERLSNKG